MNGSHSSSEFFLAVQRSQQMQKGTYLVSFFLNNIEWPSATGLVVFHGSGRVSVDDVQFNGSTGNAELDSLFAAVSYNPFLLHLSNPLVGKVDLWVKTAAVRSSLRHEMTLPLELELTQLLRLASRFVVVAPPTDDPLTETAPVSVGKLVSSARFKIMDEIFWDVGIGGFLKGPVPFDIPSVPLSLVFAPHGSSWQVSLLTPSFADLCRRLPCPRVDPLMLRTPAVLVIDPDASPLDPRILSMQTLQSVSFLRIRLQDLQSWMQQTLVPSFSGTSSSLISTRKAIGTADMDPRFSLHPYHIHWKAAVWPLGTVFQGRVPRADWTFAVSSSADSWATGIVSSAARFEHVCSQVGHSDRLPEYWDVVIRNSWRLPLLKKRHMIRLQFYEVGAAERAVFRTAKHRLMASFGLVQKPDGSWSAKAGMLNLLKRNRTVPADRLEACLEGFALTNAQELLQPSKPQCIVCATNPCNAFLDLCGHTFCDTCIQQHLTHGGTSCPVCRADLAETGWTQVRRSTSRHASESAVFAKQDQIVSLSQNLRGSKCFVTPSESTASQVLSWIGTPSEDTYLVCPRDPPVPKTTLFDHIVCTTALLPTAACLTLLHELLQRSSNDTTTLHILVARNSWHGDEEYGWVRDFSKCYANMIEMSSYS